MYFFVFCVFLSLGFVSYFIMDANALATDYFAGHNYNGSSLENLAQNYWQWWMTVPQTIDRDPKTNLQECIVGYDPTNTTIFLYNSYLSDYSTVCDISSKNSILVPLLIGECDPTVPELRSKTLSELWKCAADANEVFKFWEVTLDGETLFKKSPSEIVNPNLKQEILVRNSSIFNITIPAINHYDAPEGTYPAVVDGYYLHLKPLSPGKHTLEYKIVHEDKSVLDFGNKPRLNIGKAHYAFNVMQ